MESPNSVNRPRNFAIELCRLEGMGVDHESALLGIGFSSKVDAWAGFRFDVQNQVVRKFGGEDQRSALGRKNQLRLASAKNLRRINCTKRRRWRGADRGEPDDEHGFRIAE